MTTPTHDSWLDGGDDVIPPYARAFELVHSVSGCRDVVEELVGRKLTAEFAGAHDSPGRARRLVLSALAEWGCGPVLLQDAAVVVSELATNSVLHAGSCFSISIALEEALLRIAVHDTKPLSVAVRDGGMSPRPTHGLGLVETLSLCWGTQGTAQGKAVWAELHVAEASQASR